MHIICALCFPFYIQFLSPWRRNNWENTWMGKLHNCVLHEHRDQSRYLMINDLRCKRASQHRRDHATKITKQTLRNFSNSNHKCVKYVREQHYGRNLRVKLNCCFLNLSCPILQISLNCQPRKEFNHPLI